MSSQPTSPTWRIINRITSLVAVVAIGAIVWFAIKARQPAPIVDPVAVGDLELPEADGETADVGTSNVGSGEGTLDVESAATTTERAPDAVPDASTDKSESEQEIQPRETPVDDAAASAEQEPLPAGTPATENETPAETATTSDSDPAPEPQPAPKPVGQRWKPAQPLGPAPKYYDADIAKFLFEQKCSECHQSSRVLKYTFSETNTVDELLDRMVIEGLDVNENERAVLVYYLNERLVYSELE